MMGDRGIRGFLAFVGLVWLAAPAVAQDPGVHNDYPTTARADYVLGCMASNGQTREALEKCSCSIDTIASILPYDTYVTAETVLRMRQVGGERTGIFRDTQPAQDAVATLRRAQAEADILCFLR